MTPPFRYDTSVFIADTNCFGTVYFARYFEWQGRVREMFFRSVVPNFLELMDAGYRLLTVEASMRYVKELPYAEWLTIELDVEALQATSLALRFTFLRGRDEPVGLGHQRLVLTDRQGTPVKIPEDVRRRLEPFLVGLRAPPENVGGAQAGQPSGIAA
jgi:acyl-CoA thioesterase FadM